MFKPVNSVRAEMGVGTLIVFIAMLLVAAVAAGVLILTSTSLQEKSLSTDQQARTQISTNVRVLEISAADGRDKNLTDFEQIIKLSPGSDQIKLEHVILTFNTEDETSTLKYRGKNSICRKSNSNGYNTWFEETLGELENYVGVDTLSGGVGALINHLNPRNIGVDLDDDGAADYVWICAPQDIAGVEPCPAPYNQTDNYLVFNLSTDGYVYVKVVNDDETLVNLNSVIADSAMDITHLNIITYGYISAYRTQANNQRTIWSQDLPLGDAYFRIYESPVVLDDDLDDDGLDDAVAVNDTEAILFLGSGQIVTIPLGVNISEGAKTLDVSAVFSNATDTFASITISGTTTTADIIPAGFATITPEKSGEGYFSAVYETEGTNHIDGNVVRGDIVKLCYESPGDVTEDVLVRINFIPKTGIPSLAYFFTPDVISTERVYLYP